MKKIIIGMLVVVVIGLGFYFIKSWLDNRLKNDPNFACGNGRIEATEINIAARLAGKTEKVMVVEGERVSAGQPLVVMQTNVLVANLAKAEATKAQAVAQEANAKANIEVQEARLDQMKADYERAKAQVENAKARFDRDATLVKSGAVSTQEYDNAKTNYDTKKAGLLTAEAAIKEAEANLNVAKADLLGAKANILAAEADIACIKEDIDDSILKAPLDGRIQYRVAEPGEVLSAGGRAINMIDLTDVYMTFFLSEELAGKVQIGSEVRIVLDAAPKYPLPAKVTYVASTAQFTPKTVETQVERQKLMFRVKAHVNREVLERGIDIIKTGLPGVAWVKINPAAEWPKELQTNPDARKLAEEIEQHLQASPIKNDPSKVIESDTLKNSKTHKADAQTVKEVKDALQNATNSDRVEIEAKAAKKVNADDAAAKEKVVEQMKEANQARQAVVEKEAQKAKEVNAEAKQAPAKVNVK